MNGQPNLIKSDLLQIDNHIKALEEEGFAAPSAWRVEIETNRALVAQGNSQPSIRRWSKDMRDKISKYAQQVREVSSWRATLKAEGKAERVLKNLENRLDYGLLPPADLKKLEGIIASSEHEVGAAVHDAEHDVVHIAHDARRFVDNDIEPELHAGYENARRFVDHDIEPELHRGARYVRNHIIPEAARLGREGVAAVERTEKEARQDIRQINKADSFIRNGLLRRLQRRYSSDDD